MLTARMAARIGETEANEAFCPASTWSVRYPTASGVSRLSAAETARISRIRKKPDFCFRGGRAKMLFQIFGLLHNAHDPFHVAQAMVARIILPHIGDPDTGSVRS